MKKSIYILLLIVISFFAAQRVEAAILYFSPSSGNFTIGNIFTVSVLVNTDSKAINNSDAVINFPSHLLEVVSLTKSASIFSLWVEEPAFSNSAGTISFNGGLPTPGFNGTAGNILNAVFRVKNVGTASLIFSSGAVRANDGYGTDILKVRSQATYNLIAEEKAPPPAIVVGTPPKPKISSPTHPDSEKWYSNSTATFIWPIGEDVTAARIWVDKNPVSVPVVLYIPAITEKTVENLEDGIRYFHVGLKNNTGWGETAHFRFQIDTKSPEPFEVKIDNGGDATNPQPILYFKAEDKTSGISHYELRIGTGDVFPLPTEEVEKNPYKMPLQAPGSHSVIVKAVDKAGNTTLTDAEAVIASLEPPIITDYPFELQNGEVAVIKGETYPDSQVTIRLQKRGEGAKGFTVSSQKDGKFAFVTEELRNGVYKLWSEVTNSRGAKSGPSEELTILVKQPDFTRIGSLVISYLSVLIPLVILLAFFFFMVWYIWHKSKNLKKRLRKEISEAEAALHKAFDLLKEDIREQVKLLEKVRTERQLTKEEESIIQQLKKDLDKAEEIVRKEIEDIGREIK